MICLGRLAAFSNQKTAMDEIRSTINSFGFAPEMKNRFLSDQLIAKW
jgi:hypothetical protein